ncbi:MAG: ribosomal RNA small subunit methyltransferase A, partial [Candidatus Dojkabacteria bacterium]
PMNCEYVLSVEVDDDLVEILTERYEHIDNLEILHADVLELDLAEILNNKKINKIVGALPYNISKRIIEKLLSVDTKQIQVAGLVLQKEVAHDYAGVGNKNSFLHALYSAIYEIKIVEDIEKSVFNPVPKVDSSSIIFTRKNSADFSVAAKDFSKYAKFLKNAFRNPRKKLIKNLKSIFKETDWDKVYQNIGFEENIRVEQLTNHQLVALFHEFTEAQNNPN